MQGTPCRFVTLSRGQATRSAWIGIVGEAPAPSHLPPLVRGGAAHMRGGGVVEVCTEPIWLLLR